MVNARTVRRLWVIASLLCLLAQRDVLAWQGDAVAAAKPPEETVITLLEAGAEPRQVLRYTPEPGQEDTFRVTMRMSIAMTVDGEAGPNMDPPPMRFTIRSKVLEVESNGDIHAKMEYVKAEVLDDPSANPMMLMAMRQAIEQIEGLKGAIVMSNRGQTRSSTFDNLDQLNASLAEQIKSLKYALEQLSAPFPAEAVGQGARWKMEQDVDINGIKLRNSIEYQLLTVDASNIIVDTSVSQSAQPQDVPLPNAPGQQMHVESMASKGKGTSHVRLDRIGHVSAQVNAHTDMDISLEDMAGEKHTMQQALDIDFKVEPGDGEQSEVVEEKP